MVQLVKTFLPKLNATNLTVGLSVWQNMRPECLKKVADIDCDIGMELEYLSAAATLLNLTLIYKYTKVPGCGTVDAFGNWTGLIGMLYKREIDMTGNLCSVGASRKVIPWLKHSWPVLQYRQSFLVKAPEPRFEFSISAPFTFPVWMFIFGTFAIFVCHVTLWEMIIKRKRPIKAFLHSLINSIQITAGMDENARSCYWFLLICIVGCITTCYSTFIKSALLKPIAVERPFRNNEELAEAMLKGGYKLISYYKPSHVPRSSREETNKKFAYAIEKHGYHYFDTKLTDSNNFATLLLNDLLKYDNLVLAQGRFLLRFYLDQFPKRHKLWLLDDETSHELWSCFLYRDNFTLAQAFDQSLILMSDFKDNLKAFYFGLSYRAIQSNSVKGEVQESMVITMKLACGPLLCLLVGMSLAIASFLFERLFPPTVVRSVKRSLRKISDHSLTQLVKRSKDSF